MQLTRWAILLMLLIPPEALGQVSLEELQRLNIQFLSYREALDTSGAPGKAVPTIVSVVAELERSLIIERVRAGLRRAKAEGRRLGRPRLVIDRQAVLRDRARGMSLNQVARAHHVSKASVCKILKETPGVTNPPCSTPQKPAGSAGPQSVDSLV